MATCSEWNISCGLNKRPKGAFRSGPADGKRGERLVNFLATR